MNVTDCGNGEADGDVEWETNEGILQWIQVVPISFAEMYQRLAGYVG